MAAWNEIPAAAQWVYVFALLSLTAMSVYGFFNGHSTAGFIIEMIVLTSVVAIIATTWGSFRGHKHLHVAHSTVLVVIVALIAAYTCLRIVLNGLAPFFAP